MRREGGWASVRGRRIVHPMSDAPTFRPARALPLIVLLAGAILGAVLFRDILTFETLARHRQTLLAWRDAHYVLAALGFIAVYVLVVAFSLPGATIMTLTGGFLFGVFPGALYCVIGATLGAIAIFLAVRAGLGEALHARIRDKPGLVGRIERGVRENAVSYLLIMRLVPAVPFFLANLVPAFLGVSLGTFALTTFFGIMPGAIVYASVGAGLGEIFDRGEVPDLGIIFEPEILLPLLGLAALSALPILLRRLSRNRGDISQ